MNDLSDLTRIRQDLHRYPELSGAEYKTAERVRHLLESLQPDEIVTGVGGAGLLAVFEGSENGPTTLIRCELDALPIRESGDRIYRSTVDGCAHACGHDGHMAIVIGVAQILGHQRPNKGRVILLFQPAEEDGQGARRMFNDPTFAPYKPDYAFALHNVPGLPLGEVFTRPGPFNCASRGMIIRLTGKTSHAAHPEDGVSPAPALAELMARLPDLPKAFDESTWVTLVHARMGEKAFGTAPGEAELMATLRSETNEAMTSLSDRACALAREAAEQAGLEVAFDWEDDFLASVNTETGYRAVTDACRDIGVPCHRMPEGFRWSEDFGVFTLYAEGAMLGLGAGNIHPQLHNPDYDFPDELIPTGREIFVTIIRKINGLAPDS
ncbi:amidohydrolase [Marinobacter nanhaiticus D15-8W]|uniref:Amidohydrolase n=1 Tax=Marinobacter nanhaiticus D15-8W TaxID=626887 RepID=N6X6T5_9GAMM|nr:amidohydrolase [Marinobacter nanhaiticus]ENO16833.1 amidohydrolase [Marinobacter nanhaiticus D15-8W]BES72649.1 amidohydrolase [Marinobacter nanhaiticus D15-8W]